MEKKTIEIHLTYYKQGDDIQHAVNSTDSITEALDEHVGYLHYSVEVLKGIKEIIEKSPNEFEIEGDSHFISLTGPENLINEIIEKDLGKEIEDGEDCEYEECQHGNCGCLEMNDEEEDESEEEDE